MSFFSPRRPTKKAKISTSATQEQQQQQQQQWRETDCGTLLYLYQPTATTLHSTKIAGFDIDGTIIKTKSGKTFATNDLTDWQPWAHATTIMKPTFTKLVSDGYRIVFFTNQEGISKGKVNKQSWKTKVENVIDTLGLSEKNGGPGVTVLASLTKKENNYRKPHVGMWNFLCENLNDSNTTIARSESIYIGDAAGRPKRGPVKKDFSCTDYKFALNIGGGLTFKTPEEVFYKSQKPSDKASLETSNIGFQPRKHWNTYLDDSPLDQVHPAMESFLSSCRQRRCAGKNEIIVIVGSAASGKSDVARHVVLSNDDDGGSGTVEYVRVNQDTLKTLEKCIKVTMQAMKDGKSAVVDNINRDVKTRSSYIALAKSHGVPCRCVWIKTTKDESFHLNALRGAIGNSDGVDKRSVPDVVIHSYYKNLEDPSVSEGFEEVIELPFAPGPFESLDRKDDFFRFTH